MVFTIKFEEYVRCQVNWGSMMRVQDQEERKVLDWSSASAVSRKMMSIGN